MKKCFKCGLEKDLKEFYKHKAMKDGHLNKCKSCTKKDSVDFYKSKSSNEDWKEKERTRTREKYHRLNYKEKYSHENVSEKTKQSRKDARKRYEEKHPWVNTYTYKNLKRDLKIKPGFEAHHWNYNSDYLKDVIIVKTEDHNFIHRFIELDLEKRIFMVKSTGVLLNSKRKHERFIKEVLTGNQ